MRWRRLGGVAVAVLLGAAPAVGVADTVHLRDGRELSGYIVDDTNRSVVIVGADGVPSSVPRSQIEWVAYIGDARARAALRQALLPEPPRPRGGAAPTAGNRGYLHAPSAPSHRRTSRRSAAR